MAKMSMKERIALVKESSGREDIAKEFQRANQALVDMKPDSLRAIFFALPPHDGLLLANHLGHDGNMLVHKIAMGFTDGIDMLEVLRDYDVLDFDAPNREGKYPIHIVCEAVDLDTVMLKAMLSAGADPDVAIRSDGNRAVHLLARNLHYEGLELLRNAGADLGATNKAGQGCVSILAENASTEEALKWQANLAHAQLEDLGLIESAPCAADNQTDTRTRRAL